ncbi:hypothetical protein BDP27DRAFT_1324341 [Rhodocollybia butyracea]|uniref:Uncharacterized protein n=1 Tax=Rhodocollybia butyracea TaxID=206335 RepID=A0A9P5U8N9_9AGAR|nr:hypothetical protein BDP27DRAFT_1324341 [Rhodocollybia butyracea]
MMSYHLPSSGSPPNYYPPQHILQPHVTPPQSRQETTSSENAPNTPARRQACDEAKPSCMRCSHGQRDVLYMAIRCNPARRKSTSRKDSLELDGRPSTAGSSISEGSTPPTRDHTPPRSHPVELDLPPLASGEQHRYEPYFQLHRHPLPTSDSFRRHEDRFAYTHPSDSSSSLQMDPLPENATYVPQHRYDHSYTSHTGAARASTGLGMRAGEHISPPTHPIMDPYYPPMTVRNMMGHDSPHELHHRYR